MASLAARIRCARVDPERGNEKRNRGVGLVFMVDYPQEECGPTDRLPGAIVIRARTIVAQLGQQRA